MAKTVARILTLVFAASLGATAPARAQVPADLRAAMQARDTAFYAVDPAQWERYTAPAFTTVQQDGSFMTRAERLANLRSQTPKPYVPRSREQNTSRRAGQLFKKSFLCRDSRDKIDLPAPRFSRRPPNRSHSRNVTDAASPQLHGSRHTGENEPVIRADVDRPRLDRLQFDQRSEDESESEWT